jgi:hypothetical protein
MNYKYQVTGKAVKAIEEYEELEPKAYGERKIATAYGLADGGTIAAFAAVQAGLIRLPALVDLTK